MQRSRKLFNGKNIFLCGFIICFGMLFFIDQKNKVNAQIVETKSNKPELIVQTGHADLVMSATFSPNGKLIASASNDKTVKIWDVSTRSELKTFSSNFNVHFSVAFSPDGKLLAYSGQNKSIQLRDMETGNELNFPPENLSGIQSVSFTPDSKYFLSYHSNQVVMKWNIAGRKVINSINIDSFANNNSERVSYNTFKMTFSTDGNLLAKSFKDDIEIWDLQSEKKIKVFQGHHGSISSLVFSHDGKKIAIGSSNSIKIWNIENNELLLTIPRQAANISFALAFSPNDKILASTNPDKTISLWNSENGSLLSNSFLNSLLGFSVNFSPDGESLIVGMEDREIILLNLITDEKKNFKRLTDTFVSLSFTPDGKKLALGSYEKAINLWDFENAKNRRIFKNLSRIPDSIHFANDGKKILFRQSYRSNLQSDNTVYLYDLENEKETNRLEFSSSSIEKVSKYFSQCVVSAMFPKQNDIYDANSLNCKNHISGNLTAKLVGSNRIDLSSSKSAKLLISLTFFTDNNWVFSTSDGRFDTSKSLDSIEGLHWIVNDEFLNPLPLDIFMRQYYEPGLLQKVLKCDEDDDSCDKEFKPLPSIAEINRIQPEVEIKEIKSVADSSDLADVTIEVENVTENAKFSTTDKFKRKKLSSGAYDLRLFRDGQLVGVSAPKEKMEKFIGDAARLVEETKKSDKLIDTPEDRAWREANDIFKLSGENVKRISPTKIKYTFRNVKLPKDGRSEVSFTAYAFNSDKVKSATTEAVKFTIPQAVSDQKKKGRAVLISIGVNTSENPQYDLRYAANDARKMQEIVGAKLRADTGKYSEVVTIPLISDYKTDKTAEVNHARKTIIKAVFSLLEGKSFADAEAELFKIDPKSAEAFRSIPNIKKLEQIEPEDTLIISFSGHGYADNAGIFYLLPHDIGKDTTKLTTKNLRNTISSDELSLWLQDITAAEMMLIIDACHSSAAVQGDGFKPGPMASRGLGQLSYDKDMKILSATQADNVAVELNSLQQGLLSYALLQDGIVEGSADTDKNKQLFSNEWLNYAEKRVPELYSEIKNGKRGVFVNGEKFADGRNRSEIVNLTGNQTININLQQPTLFDFKRRKTENLFLSLP